MPSSTSATSTPSSSSPIPPPPPLSMPVWSLACRAVDESKASVETKAGSSITKTSMNIMTFCTPVSISPKLWALSLYYNTRTLDSFLVHKRGIIQLLRPEHANLVPILGKRSGYDIDKALASFDEAGIKWASMTAVDSGRWEDDHAVLPNCASYLRVEILEEGSALMEAGDHLLALCQVIQTGIWNAPEQKVEWLSPDTTQTPLDAPEVLYTGHLRREGIL